MVRMSPLQNETRSEIPLRGKPTDKSLFPRTGLLREQRLTCANHSDEEIYLDQTGWQNFNCPKCGVDYSIGRKIVILEQMLNPYLFR